MVSSRELEAAAGIRKELRSIVRLVWDLRKPAKFGDTLEERKNPAWLVMLDSDALWSGGGGLRLGGLGELSVPDERKIDKGYELAGCIYHLKDRIHQYARATSSPVSSERHSLNAEVIVKGNTYLSICGDLINLKKHGRNENRSGISPRLGNVVYDTSKNGWIEVQYDGANKATALLVENPHPISSRLQLLSGEEVWYKNALDVMVSAVETWKPVISELAILNGNDEESEFLRRVLDY